MNAYGKLNVQVKEEKKFCDRSKSAISQRVLSLVLIKMHTYVYVEACMPPLYSHIYKLYTILCLPALYRASCTLFVVCRTLVLTTLRLVLF